MIGLLRHTQQGLHPAVVDLRDPVGSLPNPASSHLPECLLAFSWELPEDLPDLAEVSAVGEVPGPHSPSSRRAEPSSVMNAPLLAFIAGLHWPPYSPKSLRPPLHGIAFHEALDRCLLVGAQPELALLFVLDRCLLERPLLAKPLEGNAGGSWGGQGDGQGASGFRSQGEVESRRSGGAHKLEQDWPFMAFSLEKPEEVFMRTAGAFGFGSAAYWWQRVAAAVTKLASAGITCCSQTTGSSRLLESCRRSQAGLDRLRGGHSALPQGHRRQQGGVSGNPPLEGLPHPLTMDGGAGPTHQVAHPPWMNQSCVGREGLGKHTNEWSDVKMGCLLLLKRHVNGTCV